MRNSRQRSHLRTFCSCIHICMIKDKRLRLYGDNYAAVWPEAITLQEPQQPVLMDDKKPFWPHGNPHLLKITSCRTVTITSLVIDPRDIQIWKLSAAFSRRNSEQKCRADRWHGEMPSTLSISLQHASSD